MCTNGEPDAVKAARPVRGKAEQNTYLNGTGYESPIPLLESRGYPKDIINVLDVNEKEVLINILLDFNRYKGTVGIFEKIINNFNKVINVYELFINYNEEYKWHFVPHPIIIKNEIDKNVKPIDYDIIYYSTPRFFINKELLEEKRLNNEINLPLKTNLITFDIYNFNNISRINNILMNIFLYKFQNEIFTIYFKEDDKYNIRLIDFIKIWNWIIYTHYNPNNNKFNSSICFYIKSDLESFLLNIDNELYLSNDFETINEKVVKYFNDIKNYDDYIDHMDNLNNFFDCPSNNAVLNKKDYNNISNYLDESLVSYINNRLKNEEFEEIVNELYDSFILWAINNQNSSIRQYHEYVSFLLPQFVISNKETNVMKIINFMKPLHVEIIENKHLIFKAYEYIFLKHNFIPKEKIWELSRMIMDDNTCFINEKMEIFDDLPIRCLSNA